MTYNILLTSYALSTIASLAMLVVSIYARSAPKSLYFSVLILAIFIFNIGYVFEVTATSLKTAFIATQVQYCGGPFIAPLVLLFVCEYCGIKIRMRSILLLLVIPAATCLLVLTWPLNGIFYTSVEFLSDSPVQRLVLQHSIYYYINQVYNVILPLTADVILIYNFFQRDKVFKKQSVMIILATVLPLLCIVFIRIVGAVGLDYDPTPIFLGLTCLLLGFSFLKFGLYRVAPIAREQIVESMSDGFVIIDNQGNFIDANIAAKRILPQLAMASAGIKMSEIEEIAWLSENDDSRDNEFSISEPDGSNKHYKLSETQIFKENRVIGRCIMFFDITNTKKLLDEVSLLAELDTLTGLMNRRSFFNNAEHLLEKLIESGDSACMMMMDVDFFKGVNDTYGHPKGDEVLKAIAEVLSSRLRNTDLIARYGGEEFCAFLPNITEQSAIYIAEQLRKRAQELVFSANESTFSITISIGLAFYDPSRHLTLDPFLSDADVALYDAKRSGRNMIRVMKQTEDFKWC